MSHFTIVTVLIIGIITDVAHGQHFAQRNILSPPPQQTPILPKLPRKVSYNPAAQFMQYTETHPTKYTEKQLPLQQLVSIPEDFSYLVQLAKSLKRNQNSLVPESAFQLPRSLIHGQDTPAAESLNRPLKNTKETQASESVSGICKCGGFDSAVIIDKLLNALIIALSQNKKDIVHPASLDSVADDSGSGLIDIRDLSNF